MCACDLGIIVQSIADLSTVRILPYLVRKTAVSSEVRRDKSKYGETHNLQYNFVYS